MDHRSKDDSTDDGSSCDLMLHTTYQIYRGRILFFANHCVSMIDESRRCSCEICYTVEQSDNVKDGTTGLGEKGK